MDVLGNRFESSPGANIVAPAGSCANVFDLFGNLYHLQKGPWEVISPESSASEGVPPLRGTCFCQPVKLPHLYRTGFPRSPFAFGCLALRGCDLRHCLHLGRPIGTETQRARVDHDRSNGRRPIRCPIHDQTSCCIFSFFCSAERQINTTEGNNTLLKNGHEIYNSSLWNHQIGRLSLHFVSSTAEIPMVGGWGQNANG
jgi:hypothetical protein